jgi:arginine repressor
MKKNKKNITEYCIFYLTNISKEATSKEICSHLFEKKLINRSFSINPSTLSHYMKDNLFKRTKTNKGVYKYRLNHKKLFSFFKKDLEGSNGNNL